jgi:ABC-type Co2+ transport system permease subunit
MQFANDVGNYFTDSLMHEFFLLALVVLLCWLGLYVASRQPKRVFVPAPNGLGLSKPTRIILGSAGVLLAAFASAIFVVQITEYPRVSGHALGQVAGGIVWGIAIAIFMFRKQK